MHAHTFPRPVDSSANLLLLFIPNFLCYVLKFDLRGGSITTCPAGMVSLTLMTNERGLRQVIRGRPCVDGVLHRVVGLCTIHFVHSHIRIAEKHWVIAYQSHSPAWDWKKIGLRLKGEPIARNSLGTLSAISQAILVGMLSVFHRVSIGTSSFDTNTVLGHFWQERCALGLWIVSRSTLSTNKTCDILALSFLKLWLL